MDNPWAPPPAIPPMIVEAMNDPQWLRYLQLKLDSLPKPQKSFAVETPQFAESSSTHKKWKYVYFVTITLKPDDDDDLVYELADKFINSKMVSSSVLSYKRAYELQQNGKPHVHFVLYCQYYLDIGKIKALKPFKQRSINIQRAKSEFAVSKYLQKPSPQDIEKFGSDQYYTWNIQDDLLPMQEDVNNIDVNLQQGDDI